MICKTISRLQIDGRKIEAKKKRRDKNFYIEYTIKMYVGYNKNAVKWKYDIAQNPFSNINVHPLYHPMGSWKIPTLILSEYHCSRVLFAFLAILFSNSVIQQRSTWI